ncbi:hypothetical protein Srot_0782 [Segniliparus rotundus DSM 44985]|uniref:YbaB/EbfC DNA-binding family protein n=1 Tax=Segniliparus rotundus (strain ATCC BAA-972 / CDC 1076 / CIP 108378 / DSM 44985 / JCM 13578) TaxID=640132 RepID=D6ZDJ7_SEGRD|nr:YbaB/EbfC family nucleoid-associated protein [Segniliparus rotundus]ADG97261.1 hypothetical protein Srot_0782 [Segniliparus rotundus DSM 44985]
MTNHDPALVARVDELRAKQRRAQEALAKVRGKGYGLNAAIVVELDAEGNLARCEVTDAASGLSGESVAGGFRCAYNEARKNVQQQVAEIMGEFETDHDAAAAIKEIQAYFGVEPVEASATSSGSGAELSTTEHGDDEWEPPQSWLRKT